jgi:hypothetical protein
MRKWKHNKIETQEKGYTFAAAVTLSNLSKGSFHIISYITNPKQYTSTCTKKKKHKNKVSVKYYIKNINK